MKFRPLGSNVTELELQDGTVILFSYKTPVAAYIPGQGYVRTSTHYSRTTSKHITQWERGRIIGGISGIVPQSTIDALAQ